MGGGFGAEKGVPAPIATSNDTPIDGDFLSRLQHRCNSLRRGWITGAPTRSYSPLSLAVASLAALGPPGGNEGLVREGGGQLQTTFSLALLPPWYCQ